MKTLAWLLKNVVLPLAPFLVGAGVRILHGGEFHMSYFSPTELAFSMAMMFLLLASSASALANPATRDALSSGFFLGVIVFLALFAIGLFLDVDLYRTHESFIELARTKVQSSQAFSPADLPPLLSHNDLVFSRIRLTTFCCSGFAVALAIFVGTKYDLMNA